MLAEHNVVHQHLTINAARILWCFLCRTEWQCAPSSMPTTHSMLRNVQRRPKTVPESLWEPIYINCTGSVLGTDPVKNLTIFNKKFQFSLHEWMFTFNNNLCWRDKDYLLTIHIVNVAHYSLLMSNTDVGGCSAMAHMRIERPYVAYWPDIWPL